MRAPGSVDFSSAGLQYWGLKCWCVNAVFTHVKLECKLAWVMALGSDVRDILELEGADEKDEFITKEALFSDPKKVFNLFSRLAVIRQNFW